MIHRLFIPSDLRQPSVSCRVLWQSCRVVPVAKPIRSAAQRSTAQLQPSRASKSPSHTEHRHAPCPVPFVVLFIVSTQTTESYTKASSALIALHPSPPPVPVPSPTCARAPLLPKLPGPRRRYPAGGQISPTASCSLALFVVHSLEGLPVRTYCLGDNRRGTERESLITRPCATEITAARSL